MTETTTEEKLRKALDDLEEGVHYFVGAHHHLLDGIREETTLWKEQNEAVNKILKLAENARKALGKK